MLADSSNIKYEDGLNKKRIPITATTLKMVMGIIDDEEAPEEPVEAATAPVGGLMGSPSPEENTEAPADVQAAMLGMTDEEEEV